MVSATSIRYAKSCGGCRAVPYDCARALAPNFAAAPRSTACSATCQLSVREFQGACEARCFGRWTWADGVGTATRGLRLDTARMLVIFVKADPSRHWCCRCTHPASGMALQHALAGSLSANWLGKRSTAWLLIMLPPVGRAGSVARPLAATAATIAAEYRAGMCVSQAAKSYSDRRRRSLNGMGCVGKDRRARDTASAVYGAAGIAGRFRALSSRGIILGLPPRQP